jgi:hypothetical protein
MSINKVQFQEGYSILELFDNYGTDIQCRQALFDWKFPEGFVCSQCGSKAFCELKKRKLYQCKLYQCNCCHYQASVTSETIFDSTK